jgi:hypothetical protein
LKQRTLIASLPDNAYARKALESLRQIEEEAARKKAQQVEVLREAIGNIDQKLGDLRLQRHEIEQAIAGITGKAPAGRRPRSDHSELRGRVLRWLSGHPGSWYTASELQREFSELEQVAVSMFLKSAVEEGKVKVDKSGGNRNTKYSAAAA